MTELILGINKFEYGDGFAYNNYKTDLIIQASFLKVVTLGTCWNIVEIIGIPRLWYKKSLLEARDSDFC